MPASPVCSPTEAAAARSTKRLPPPLPRRRTPARDAGACRPKAERQGAVMLSSPTVDCRQGWSLVAVQVEMIHELPKGQDDPNPSISAAKSQPWAR